MNVIWGVEGQLELLIPQRCGLCVGCVMRIIKEWV